jgi:hypothetical protein
MISEKNRWLFLGIVGITFFGLFGFFNKLSTFTNAFVANLFIQITSLVIATILFFILWGKFKFSKSSALAGICVSIGTLFLLFALEANQLIIVYPFAAMAGVVFFTILHLTHKHKYTAKQFSAILAGLGLGIIGLAFAAIGASGGFSNFISAINAKFLLLGLLVMLFFGLLSYFWFKARVLQKEETLSCLLSNMIGASIPAIIGVLVFGYNQLLTFQISTNLIYPILSGASAVIGAYAILSALGSITPKEPTKGLILAIFTNGEIIPVTILALLILHEYSLIGLLGVCATLAGLTLLNYTEYLK